MQGKAQGRKSSAIVRSSVDLHRREARRLSALAAATSVSCRQRLNVTSRCTGRHEQGVFNNLHWRIYQTCLIAQGSRTVYRAFQSRRWLQCEHEQRR